MPDGTCLGSNRLLLDGLSAYLVQPKGLEFGKDTWREASHRRKIHIYIYIYIYMYMCVCVCVCMCVCVCIIT